MFGNCQASQEPRFADGRSARLVAASDSSCIGRLALAATAPAAYPVRHARFMGDGAYEDTILGDHRHGSVRDRHRPSGDCLTRGAG